MVRILLLVIGLLFSAKTVFAAVWQHQRQWDDNWQREYARWIRTEVTGDFFHRLGRPYSRLAIDCADAHYALTAYFARMNSLPFAISNGSLTNLTDQYDHIQDPEERMYAFIRIIAANHWTESLVFEDTYPPAISDLKPGDLYMWKTGSGSTATRHTYIIKDINTNGTFNVLYSTQANAAQAGPLYLRTQYTFPHSPRHQGPDRNRWGFRRMKLPQHSRLAQEQVPGASFEQYEWASQLSTVAFNAQIQQVLTTIQEPADQLVIRHLNNLCSLLQDRVAAVNNGLRRRAELGNACMDSRDYDIYSTPSRDSGIRTAYESFLYALQGLDRRNQWQEVPPQLQVIASGIFSDSEIGINSHLAILEMCPVQFGTGEGQVTDMRQFRQALYSNEVSYHPNDNLLWRWGFPSGARTSCPAYYGYPTR